MAQNESDMGILPLTNMNFISPPPNEKQNAYQVGGSGLSAMSATIEITGL
jgi:hypothetical protein